MPRMRCLLVVDTLPADFQFVVSITEWFATPKVR